MVYLLVVWDIVCSCTFMFTQHLYRWQAISGNSDVWTRHVTMLREKKQACCQWMWQATGLDAAVLECYFFDRKSSSGFNGVILDLSILKYLFLSVCFYMQHLDNLDWMLLHICLVLFGWPPKRCAKARRWMKPTLPLENPWSGGELLVTWMRKECDWWLVVVVGRIHGSGPLALG